MDELELQHVIRDLHASLRALQGFGVRAVRPAAAPSGDDPDPAEETQHVPGGRETAGAAPEPGVYHFGQGRQARWAQATRSRGARTEEPASRETGRRQVHMFAAGDTASGEDSSAAPAWTPNPLSPNEATEQLEALRAEIGDCSRCRLSEQRNHIVFGEGNPVARLVLAGEGPGRDEDRTGRPFVGRAGQLLDRILSAMGLGRDDVYICNVVKCRPPENRTPQDDEMRTCGQFLTRQLEIIRPRHIIALGGTAAKYLLGTNQSMNRLRGRFYPHPCGARLLATYHPAYLLRNPHAKKPVWEDVQLVMAEMNQPVEEPS